MKIILSRKGFDSSNGGVPSPIYRLSDGTLGLYSLPIPVEQTTCEYADIQWNGTTLRDLISSLRRRKRTKITDGPHLDPDLVRTALKNRHPEWRPIFGQSGGQETQLQKMGVHDPKGIRRNRPLFLFFGWYRKVESWKDGYRYVRSAQNIHAFFGWLQVERKILLIDRRDVQYRMPWAALHPHVACDYYDGSPNAAYIAPQPGSRTDRLILGDRETDLPAAGMFRRFDPEFHTLTLAGHTRTHWRLPAWFHRDGLPKLGMHTDVERWLHIPQDNEHVHLQTVDIGQEFVFDSNDHDETVVFAWIENIVRAGIA